MRPIDAEDLKKAVEDLVAGGAERLKEYYEHGSGIEESQYVGGVYDAWELIDNAPTIERKTGKWLDIYKSHIAYECSCCGFQHPINPKTDNFCSYCGAYMRGEEE